MRNQGFKLVGEGQATGGILVIANGETESEAVTSDMRNLRGVTIAAPAGVTLTGVVKVQVSLDGGTSWVYLQSGGLDVEVPSSRAAAIDYVGWDQIRVISDSAEGAARSFLIRGVEEIK